MPELLNATESSKYRSIVGALGFYVTALRYDIAYPLSRLAQFSCRPTVGSMKALQLVLAYLKCSTDFSLQGPIIPEGMTTPSSSNPNPNPIPNNNPNSDPIRLNNSHGDVLTVYSDSDHAGHRDEHSHSQSGLLVMLNHTPVFWRSAKQGSIALSSATAEIYALSEAVKNARLFQWRGQELGLPLSNPISIKVDNLQARSFARGTCVASKIRGTFDMRAEWVGELRNSGAIEVDYVTSTNNLADLLTKSHKNVRFEQLMGMIGRKAVKKAITANSMACFMALVNPLYNQVVAA